MAKKEKDNSCRMSIDKNMSCCKIESLISVDDRGQMVLPKEIRDKANIHAGDKLALISWERENRVCCFTLIKAEELSHMVQGMLRPLMNEA